MMSTESPHVRESKTVPRHGFRIAGTGFHSLSVELGFWIPIASGIPDSLSCIPDSTNKFFSDFGFHAQNFSGFQNQDFLTRGELNVSFFLPSTQQGLLLHTVDNEVSALGRLLFVRISWLGKKQLSVVRIIKRVELKEMVRPFPVDKEKYP